MARSGVLDGCERLAAAALRRLPPETAHRATIAALAAGWGGRGMPGHDPRLARTHLGLAFATPIGLAAGFDKDARATQRYASLGFGFAEIGTVTPLAQEGNARPRMFRLASQGGVINRMGFNNEGLTRCLDRLAAQRRGQAGGLGIPVGINVGINKAGADPLLDYPALVRAVAPVADYVVINVSSPNTPGLRDLQGENRLRAILDAVARVMPDGTRLFVKLSPDLAQEALPGLVRGIAQSCASGIVAFNTTVSRPPGLPRAVGSEAGGLSGRPLRGLAKRAFGFVARARDEAEAATGRRLLLVSAGGIEDGFDVAERLRAGAALVQIYTGFAYGGRAALARIEDELLRATGGRWDAGDAGRSAQGGMGA